MVSTKVACQRLRAHAVVNINTTEVRSAQQQMQYVIDVTRKVILVYSVLQKIPQA